MLSVRRLFYLLFFVGTVSLIFFIYNYNEEKGKNITIEQKDFVQTPLYEREDKLEESNPLFLVFGNSKKDIDKEIYANTTSLLEDLKQTYQTFEEKIDELTISQPTNTIIIFCVDTIADYISLEWLGEFIESGGKVIFAAGLSEGTKDSYLWPYLGIQEKTSRVNYNKFRMNLPFFPVQEELLTYGGFNASTWIKVSDKAIVYIEEQEKKVPLVYSFTYGEGITCLINGTFLEEPLSKGMLTSAIVAICEDFVYPVVGKRLVFLDNFPMVTFVSDKVSMNLYGRDTESFVRDVIWPEFMGIAVRDHVEYTSSVLVVSDEIEDFPKINDSLFSTIGKSALQYNGEVAFAADYTKIKEPAYNEEFLETFHQSFVNYQVQSLVLTGETIEDSMFTLFDQKMTAVRGNLDRVDNNLHFDIGENYFVFPRATYGNNLTDGNLLYNYSVLGSYGMISHVFNVNTMVTADGKTATWDQDKDQIGIFAQSVADQTEFLESITLSESYDAVNSYVNLSYNWQVKEDYLQISGDHFVSGQSYFYHSDKEIASSDGGEFTYIGNGYYLLTMNRETTKFYYEKVE